MAAFFSFTQRNTGHQQPTDPWNLGVSTSTSTAETMTQQSSSDDTLLSTRSPPTPEGLRPRKSIQRIREDILERNYYIHDTNSSHNLPAAGEADSHPAEIHRESSTLPIRRPFSSFGRRDGLGILPSSFQRIDGSPIRSASSFYEQSVEKSNNFNDEDCDIDSSMEGGIFLREPRRDFRQQQVAVSPDLKRGGKAKTAVGALLVAMAETSVEPKKTTMFEENRYKMGVRNVRHHHRILPPRAWMNSQPIEDEFLGKDYIDEDDTIRDDSNQVAHFNDAGDNDNQSSLHASPSSLRRDFAATSWIDRHHQFQNDTSFTRRILNDEPSSSRLEERSILGHSPYDFNPITKEDIQNDSNRESFNAPRLLSILKDNGRFNLSAISYSHHQNEIESTNTSLADTIEDEEEEYREIPMYYQALADDAPNHFAVGDDALILTKAQNQRRDKEDLLRSTFERLQDCLDLLKEVYAQSRLDNSLFLGLGKTKAGTEYYRHLQGLLSELKEGASYGAQRQALLFCMSILQNTASFSSNAVNVHSNFSSPHWVPLPGFRSSLGLKEEPQSPQTFRGGDTSLFSLPSDSANENTPHTSNVSLATTITTVVSPDKYESVIYKKQHQRSYLAPSDQKEGDINLQGVRKAIESLARLLYRMEETCCDLKSKSRVTGKPKFIESIQIIYVELLNISAVDLRGIINSFEMEFSESQNLTRMVSDDQDVAASRLPPHFRCSYQNERSIIDDHVACSRDALRVNIVQCDDGDIDSRNQSIECGLWSPTTNDMMSLISPQNEEESVAIMNDGYSELKDDRSVDDLRRTAGSFDEECVEDEREAPPSLDERERDHAGSFPATFARRVVAQRSRKSRFWKKGFTALKKRGRQATAE